MLQYLTSMTQRRSPIESYFDKASCYHYYFFFIIFSTKLPLFWHILSLIFLSPPMEYTCGKDGALNECPCDTPEWNRSVFTETLQTKYGIICNKTWMISFSQSMLYVGLLIGAMTFGFMSDRFGRLRMFSLSCLTTAVAGTLVVVMPSATAFIVIRCIEGIGVGGAIVTGYVLCVEYCGVDYRETVTALFHIPINIGHSSLALVSYLLRHCDHFQIALTIPVYLCCLIYCLTFESPKWLIDKGDIPKATLVMQKIAKFNKENPAKIKAEMDSYYAHYTAAKRVKLSFWQIFKYKRLTINLACMSFIYFMCGMGYYGVSLYIGKMSGNIHANVAISGALLIPATLLSTYLLKTLGRRTFLMSTCFLSGIFMLIVICIPAHMSLVRVMFACVCNCFFFMSFIIVFLYGVELFPTSIRNSVLGFLSTLSRLGQISAPPLNVLPPTVSGATFGAMAILGGILCFPLPETKNKELPDSLEEAGTAAPQSK